MIKREKVLKGLEHCTSFGGTYTPCNGCPYDDPEEHCQGKLLEEALSLLREQEPRVMTEGDVLHSTGKPMWFESRGMYLGQKGFWCLSFEVDPESHFKFVQPLTGGRLTLSLNDYDKTWRVWDKYPSPEQMRDTPWEGDVDEA